MTFNEAKVKRDRIGKFAEKTGEASVVELQMDASAELESILHDQYGIGLDDIPADHNGNTVASRWNELTAALEGERRLTPEETVEKYLGLDFGRHRGTWLSFRDDDKDIEDWDDARPPVEDWGDREVAAIIHTRMGGGNRECWCDEDDIAKEGHHCYTDTIEKMQEHPDFINDEDNAFDRTYANFAFSVPRELVEDAVRNQQTAFAQRNAKTTLDGIRKGTIEPWRILDRNPNTEAEVERLRAEAKELSNVPELPRKFTGQGTPIQKRDSLDRSIAILKGKKVPEEPRRYGHIRPFYSDPGLMAEHTAEGIKENKPKHDAYLAAKKMLDDPETPKAIHLALETGVDSPFGLKYNSQKYKDYVAKRKELLTTLTTMREEISVVTDRLDEAAEKKAKAEALSKDMHWPSVDVARPERITPVETEDPWG